MKKFLKIFLIIFINIIIVLFLFFVSDVITYFSYLKIFEKDIISISHNDKYCQFGYHSKLPIYISDLKNFFNGYDNTYMGRKPDGLEYKNSSGIVIFGGSYAYGLYLNYNQTISYKLAHQLKRTVYNRAISGGGFQHMYFQTVDFGRKDFFNDIPNLDTVIYIMINDHYNRMKQNYFSVLLPYMIHTYSYKNGKFKLNDNKIINFLKSSYTVKNLSILYLRSYFNNPKNAEKITDMTVKYFEETKNALEKHYGKKIKFYVILYETLNVPYKNLLTKKLEDKGFIVISTKELTNEDLTQPKYLMKDNNHPKEAAWDLLTPLIAEKIKITD